MGRLGLEPILHLLKDMMKTAKINLSMEPIQDLDKTAHMRPLEPMGQIHIHVDRGHGMLTLPRLIENCYGIRDGLDPDLFDIDASVVQLALDIFHNRTYSGK
jgi:hypothetical protein